MGGIHIIIDAHTHEMTRPQGHMDLNEHSRAHPFFSAANLNT